MGYRFCAHLIASDQTLFTVDQRVIVVGLVSQQLEELIKKAESVGSYEARIEMVSLVFAVWRFLNRSIRFVH